MGAVSHVAIGFEPIGPAAIDPHRLHATSSARRGSLLIWNRLDRLHQRFPILWRIASISHNDEHRVSVALRAMGPLSLKPRQPYSVSRHFSNTPKMATQAAVARRLS